jgi:hypothetical protein
VPCSLMLAYVRSHGEWNGLREESEPGKGARDEAEKGGREPGRQRQRERYVQGREGKAGRGGGVTERLLESGTEAEAESCRL